MYEAFNPKTGEIERVDFEQLQMRLADGSLVSSLDEKPAQEPVKRGRKPKAADDENQG